MILPSLTTIQPRLTPLAAAGLTTVMAGAVVTHIARGDGPMFMAPLILGALSAFVAYGRTKLRPIAAR